VLLGAYFWFQDKVLEKQDCVESADNELDMVKVYRKNIISSEYNKNTYASLKKASL